ncbi:hypothetical protein QR680_003081 [Steinernema hermaphroditum]|uniref:Uncharacterized protein n=1 Tax=Steinernema hermaphroditum TaxID=289476 RepID=A0AA39H5C1_9BILA|nr:hypothetical protein QR680_003081 [Steinernema hermaphroditum]
MSSENSVNASCQLPKDGDPQPSSASSLACVGNSAETDHLCSPDENDATHSTADGQSIDPVMERLRRLEMAVALRQGAKVPLKSEPVVRSSLKRRTSDDVANESTSSKRVAICMERVEIFEIAKIGRRSWCDRHNSGVEDEQSDTPNNSEQSPSDAVSLSSRAPNSAAEVEETQMPTIRQRKRIKKASFVSMMSSPMSKGKSEEPEYMSTWDKLLDAGVNPNALIHLMFPVLPQQMDAVQLLQPNVLSTVIAALLAEHASKYVGLSHRSTLQSSPFCTNYKANATTNEIGDTKPLVVPQSAMEALYPSTITTTVEPPSVRTLTVNKKDMKASASANRAPKHKGNVGKQKSPGDDIVMGHLLAFKNSAQMDELISYVIDDELRRD